MASLQPYLVKELESSPMKAMAAPVAAVVLQPIRSVKMLTMGEQKKIMPMAKEPTHAVEKEKKGERQGGTLNRGQEGKKQGLTQALKVAIQRSSPTTLLLMAQLTKNTVINCTAHQHHGQGAICSISLVMFSFYSPPWVHTCHREGAELCTLFS